MRGGHIFYIRRYLPVIVTIFILLVVYFNLGENAPQANQPLLNFGLESIPNNSVELVKWTNGSNVEPANGTLTKIGGTAAWDSGASSGQKITYGYGYLEFSVPAESAGKDMAIGLSHDDTNKNFDDIEFAFKFSKNSVSNYAKVMRRSPDGRYTEATGTLAYSPGDRFRMVYEDGIVVAYHNGEKVAQSNHNSITPAPPFIVDTAIYSPGAGFSEVRISYPTWQATTEIFVSPQGTPFGTGTKALPIDLTTAFSGKRAIKPGDTVWLRGGTYVGKFTSNLRGESDKPVIVRNYKNERAIIDLNIGNQLHGMTINGSDTWYWGLEITDSHPVRSTTIAGSTPPDVYRGTVSIYGERVKFINSMIYDLGNALGLWEKSLDSELYGNITFNNGWNGPDRGHGHGFYTQNRVGTKKIAQHISFNNFATGGKSFGEQGYSTGYEIDGIVHFNNGSPAGLLRNNLAYRQADLLMGSSVQPSDRISVKNSFFYQVRDTFGGGAGIGYLAKPNTNGMLVNNYFMGGPRNMGVSNYVNANVTGNTIFSRENTELVHNQSIANIATPGGELPSNYKINDNRYYDLTRARDGKRYSFWFTGLTNQFGTGGLTWDDWRTKGGFDADSTYQNTLPPNSVHVRANKYEPGRGHVVIYNWSKVNNMSVDLSSIGLSAGDEFEIMDVQNLFGDAVYSGTYNGGKVTLSLANRNVTVPVGMVDAPAHTLPEFGVFLVRKVERFAEVEVTKSADKAAAISGETVTYTVNFKNVGNATGTNVIISDMLPANTTFVSASDGGTIAADGTVRWSVGTIPAGGNGQRTMKVKAN